MATLAERLLSWPRRSRTTEYGQITEDEALMGKESGELSDSYLQLQAKHRKLERWLTAISLLLGMALAALVATTLNATIKNDDTNKSPLSPVPTLPLTPIKFERDDRYAAPSTPETDQAWGSLSPPGDGFIFVNNSASYNLQPGKPTPQGEVYDISLFHQLHCLAHIRTYAFTLKAGMLHNNTREVYNFLLKKQEDHVYHCFDYIRQAIMCAGDMTVEWPRAEADGRRFAVDGWGITHQCRSWEGIMDFMMENTVANAW